MKVSDVMTRDVVSVSPGASLREAANLLLQHRVSGLPVADDDGRVVGVISEGDFVSAAGHRGGARDFFVRVLLGSSPDKDLPTTSVGAVMTAPARTVEPGDALSEAASRMVRWGVKRLPVTEHDRLVGMITRADIVQVYSRTDEDLTRAATGVLSAVEGIQVEDVRDGKAFLSGEVSHRAIAEAARLMVRHVEGMVDVDISGVRWRHGLNDEE